jgi:hypothetical protein
MLLALLALRTGVAMVILVGSPCDTAMGPSQAATDAKPVSKIEASAAPCSSQHAQKAPSPVKSKPKADEGPGAAGTQDRDRCLRKDDSGQSSGSAHRDSLP